ncbi:MAG: hypothetical protein ABJB17_04495 [Burkholderiales bacterium]
MSLFVAELANAAWGGAIMDHAARAHGRYAAAVFDPGVLADGKVLRHAATRPRAQASRIEAGYIVLVAIQIVDAAYRLGFLMPPTLGAGAHLACI